MTTILLPVPAFLGLPSFLAGDGTLLILALAAAGLFGFYVYVYRMETHRLRPGQRRVLNALRMGVAVVGLLMMARPAVTLVQREERLPVLPLLLDESMSMNFPECRDCTLLQDLPRDKHSRFDSAMAAAQLLQEKLAKTHRVQLYIFSDSLRYVRDVPFRNHESAPSMTKDELFKDLRPSGAYSNIGDSVVEQMRRLEDARTSGIVLLTDGRQTGGEKLSEAAALASGAKIPIHSITLGSEFPLRDLRIDEVSVPPDASLGDVLKFQTVVTNQISDPLEMNIELYEDGKLLKKQKVSAKRGQSSIPLYSIPTVEGLHEYRIVLPRFEEEANYENNEATVHVRVVKRSLKVLLIVGEPTIDYHYLAPALIRDPVIDLSCWLQSADIDYVQQGNTNIEKLPATLAEWSQYDVAILYDPDPNKLTSQQMAGLEHLVTKGGGLLLIAGRNFGLGKLVQIHGLKARSLLPVEIDRNLQPDQEGFYDKPFKVERTPRGKGHPVMFCENNPELNEQVWATFPDLYWSHPVEGLTPGAVPLLQKAGGGKGILMATQNIGEGKVFYSGVNSLWLWRYPGGSYDYDRFWTRVIRYLGESKLHGTQQNVALGSDKRVYAPGENVKFSLQILDPALMQQLEGVPVHCAVKDPNGGAYMVSMMPAKDGVPLYTGHYLAMHVGSLVAQVRQPAPKADSEEKPLFEVQHSLQVKMQSLEEVDTSADLEAMKELSDKSGGMHFNHHNMANLAQLVDAIPADKQVLTQEKVVEVWDSSGFLLIFLILACFEWCLRKYWGVL